MKIIVLEGIFMFCDKKRIKMTTVFDIVLRACNI